MKRKLFLIPIVIFALLAGLFVAMKTTTKPAPKPSATSTPTPTDQLAIFYNQKPVWADCGGGFQCTTINVPLDYANPANGSIRVALNRLPASDPAKRIGSLLVNPGGPGGSGLEYARGASQIVSAAVLKRFDLVGFDPRGVGESTQIRCLSDREEDQLSAMDQSPDDKFEMQSLVFAAKLLIQRCKSVAEDKLPFMGTADVARDMDVIRAVVGDKKLNYLGKSYGTYIGAIYADIFPKRVGRVVLDGAVDPTLDETQAARAQVVGFQGALVQFAKNCVAVPGCPLGSTAKEVVAKTEAFIANLDRTPLKTDTRRKVTQSLGILGLVSALYDQDYGWPELEDALDAAFGGNGTLLLSLADQYLNRDPSGKFLDNSNEISYIVGCHDRRGNVSGKIAKIDADNFAKISPIFGPYLAYSMLPCQYWPGNNPYPLPIDAKGAGPILVVGTTRDPATPYVWAQSLAKQLSSARLLTWYGDGHTAYDRGSACVDTTVDSYLLYGTLPAGNKTCRK